ncbi:MAG: histidine phosphatase family protein [Planctomycetes bacterium]|nr:histidine phosphatase family protein [Planctomycetota bacterium]
MQPQSLISPKRLTLIRHGDVPPQFHGRYLGATDVPLGDKGRTQAALIASSNISRENATFLISPLIRARETAELAFPDEDLAIIDNLREMDFGKWECKSFAEMSVELPDEAQRMLDRDDNFSFKDGEDIGTFMSRIRALEGLIKNSESDSIVCVTHGGVIRNLICVLLGVDSKLSFSLTVDYASITILDIFEAGARLKKLNDTSHLERRNG